MTSHDTLTEKREQNSTDQLKNVSDKPTSTLSTNDLSNDLSNDLPKAKRLHLPHIDGLRALAAIFVLVHHAYLTVWSIPRGSSDHNLFLYGHFAVTLFIVISGFCLMLPVTRANGELKGGFLTFYKRRVRRIIPTYYYAIGFSLLLCLTLVKERTGTHWDVSVPVTLKGLIVRLLLLQDFGNFRSSAEINHAFWSIAVECHIYLLFPLFVSAWKRFGVFPAALGIIGAFLLLPQKYVPLNCIHYYGLFVFGMLAAQIGYAEEPIFHRIRRTIPWGTLMLMALSLLVYRCSKFPFANIPIREVDTYVAIAAMSLLVIVTRSPNGPLNRLLSTPFLAWIGAFAYSIYLIHAPLLQVVWQYMLHPLRLNEDTTFILLAVVGTPLIVGCSYLFYLLCERPFASTRKPA